MPFRRLLASVLVLLCALPVAAFEWTADDTGAIEPMETLVSFHTTLTNTGPTPDTFTLTLTGDLPAGWSKTFCVGTTCYPPWVLSVDVPLAPGAHESILIDLAAFSTEGLGTVTVTTTSLNDPGDVQSRDFTLATPGAEFLVVLGAAGPGPYYADTLGRLGRTHIAWPRWSAGPLERHELEHFQGVLWSSGLAPGSLQAADRAVFGDWLADGGRLFMSGQELAEEAGDPANPHYSAAAESWFEDVLGVRFLGEGTLPWIGFVTGVAGHPVTDDWAGASTFGGDGNVPLGVFAADVVEGVGAGFEACLYIENGPSGHGAVAANAGRGSSFFCGFAWEGLATASGRDGLLERVFDWWDGALTGVETPGAFALAPTAAPNPFNPATELRFSLAAAAEGDVTVHDLRGRAVRTLFSGRLEAGERTLRWDGRDDAGRVLPGGIYLARVRAGGATHSLKLTLAK